MEYQKFNEYDFTAFWIDSHPLDWEIEKSILKHQLIACILEYEESSIRSCGASQSTIEELLIQLIGSEGVKCDHTWSANGLRRKEILEEWLQKWGPLESASKFRFVNHKYMHSIVSTHPELISWAIQKTSKLNEIHELCWPRYGSGEIEWEVSLSESVDEDSYASTQSFKIDTNFDEMTSEEFLHLDSNEMDAF